MKIINFMATLFVRKGDSYDSWGNVERSATKYPNKTAIVFKDRRVNYKDLNAEANKLGRALNALGVGQNDKVGVLMNNCPEFVTGVFAALKPGPHLSRLTRC